MNDLKRHIEETRLIDTHEHLVTEEAYVQEGPDLLQVLFGHYVRSDLVCAGASESDAERLLDSTNPDLTARFELVRHAWERCRHTGFGWATQIIADRVYGMDEITADTLLAAVPRHQELRRPGERLRLLREVGNLDHVQVDDGAISCLPDSSGPDFFLYDLSWHRLARGEIQREAIHAYVGVDVKDLQSLSGAMEAIFAKSAPCAIAVKSQHAYDRTLQWEPRTDAEAEDALGAVLKDPGGCDPETRLCLGDWCLGRGSELAAQYDLPFKIHTGTYGGNNCMPIERVPAGQLCSLLMRYPQTRFVLMHIAYPYSDELVSLVKHFSNVYADLCWAWSINPHVCTDFVRSLIHAAPDHKVFAFGGDVFWPGQSVAYAIQAREGLRRALQAEVDNGLIEERDAIQLATRFMRTNQEACFDLAGTRTAIAESMQGAVDQSVAHA